MSNKLHNEHERGYPVEPMPAIVGPVKRGVAEPSVGFVLSGVGGGCWGGFGLGVQGRSMCFVGIAGDRTLIIDGATFGESMGIARQETQLTPAMQAAAKSDGGRYGITIQIRQKELAVTLRAGTSGAMQEMKASAPLAETQRERLLNKNMSMVGKGGYPGFVPYIDDARRTDADLTKPAAANRWSFAGLDRLETLYRASWRLKDKAPAALLKRKAELLDAVDKDPATQARVMADSESHLAAVIDAVKACGGDPRVKSAALADLAGVVMIFGARRGQPPQKIVLETRLNDRIGTDMEGTLTVSVQSGVTNVVVATHPLGRLSRRTTCFTDETVTADPKQPVTCTATATLRWRGEPVTVTQIQTVR
ncbi:MAG: hypothetical protein WCR06_00860 [bacterium]